MRYILLLLLLSSCSNFAPPFDTNVNAKLAEIKTNAMDMKKECLLNTVSSDMIHDRLEIQAMTLQAMVSYRDSHTAIAANGIWKEITSFETRIQIQAINAKQPHISPTYCKDKLNDIVLTVNAIMKPYGTL